MPTARSKDPAHPAFSTAVRWPAPLALEPLLEPEDDCVVVLLLAVVPSLLLLLLARAVSLPLSPLLAPLVLLVVGNEATTLLVLVLVVLVLEVLLLLLTELPLLPPDDVDDPDPMLPADTVGVTTLAWPEKSQAVLAFFWFI